MAFLILMFMLLVSVSPSTSASSWLSPKKFVNSANEVRIIIQQAHYILSPFSSNVSEHSSDGISDCMHLLQMSSEQLRISMSAMQNPKGKDKLGTGNLSSDLRTWLSAVLTNLDTCIEGLEEGTALKGIASKELNRVMSLVQTLLDQVIHVHNYDQVVNKDQFPSWISEEDKMMILSGNTVRTPDAVVAADGSGRYRNLIAAVQDAPDYSMKKYVIYVKRGIYRDEYVKITQEKRNIVLIGDGIDATVISGSRNHADGYSTFNSASFVVEAAGFIACNISFKNTAGPVKGMAVALRSDSDLSLFYRCGIFGYQDSLYPHSQRQFYKECIIAGTVDFIFGDAQAVFQNCQILVKQGTQTTNTITAQGRIDPSHKTGFSFQYCKISADTDLQPTTETYLGRPWKNYSRVIFMESYLSNIIHPKGWLEWPGQDYSKTLTYGEYKNVGPGAKVANRVKWSGYHILDESEAKKFTVHEFIDGDIWLPSTGVNYTSGL